MQRGNEAAHNKTRPLLTWTLLAAALAAAFPAAAQTTAPDSEELAIPEVKVTAERRESSLQKTPVAVNSLSAKEIEQSGLRRLGDLNGLAAGVTSPTSSTNGTTAIYIRGIGTSRPIGSPSVGLYLDEVYVPRPFGAGFYGSLPDIERIEILHGPQGTLYGQNTSAGAIKFVSIQPGDQAEGWLSAGIGNHGGKEVSAYAGGALKPGLLAASVAYTHDEKDGEIPNATLGHDVGRNRNDQFRTSFRLTPGGGFDATLTFDGMEFKQDWVVSPHPRFVPGAGRRADSSLEPTQDYQGGGAALKLNQQLNEHLTLRSITAWRGFSYTLPTDYDVTPARIFGFTQDLDQHQLSQEFQLLGDYDRFNYVAGVSLFKESFDVDRLSWTNNAYSILQSHNTTRSAGIYGQGNYRLTDQWGVTAGLRVNRELKGLDAVGYRSNEARQQLASTFLVRDLLSGYNATTPKLSVNYQATPNLLGYLSWSKGQTAGGYNAAPGNAAVAAVPIDTEKVSTLELGIKDSAWNGRLKTSAALFYSDYRDYQASISNPIINGTLVTGSVIANAGKSSIYGIELEAAVKLTRQLDARFSLAYLKSKFDDFVSPTGAADSNLTGAEMPNAPRLTASASTTYALPLVDGGAVRLTGNVSYQSDSYSDITQYRELTKYPSQVFVNGGAAYTTPDRAWTVSLSVKNLFDKSYVLPATYTPSLGLYAVSYNPTRQVRLGVKRVF